MALSPMFKAVVNSPRTILTSAITDSDTTIPVDDLSIFADAPNTAVIWEDGQESLGETIHYTVKDTGASTLTGVTREYQGVKKAWPLGASIARLYTAKDHDTFVANIEQLNTDISTHAQATTVHDATAAATADRLVLRDASGRAKVAGPSADADIATKGYVDGKIPGQKNSIELDSGDLQLVGDSASPGADKVYGTDESGNKGWRDFPPTPPPDDTSGSPGPVYLIAGTMDAGFFGEVPASELITGEDLCAAIGLSQGTLQQSGENWLKFAWRNKILFVNKKAIRNSVSWDAIAAAGAVYGDGGPQGDAQVQINGLTYKVRLMRGAANDPTDSYDDPDRGGIGPDNEWNHLMLPIHERAPSSWEYPQYVDSPTPVWNHGLGSGEGALYSDEDLLTHNTYGDGSYSWCQETRDTNTSNRVLRGYNGVSYLNSYASSFTNAILGARFVLELL